MKLRHERLTEHIRNTASEVITELSRENIADYWIISVTDVVISADESYADLFVTSHTGSEKELPKILARFAPSIEKALAKRLSIRKIPRIRFKAKKNAKNSNDILSIIHSLDKQYGLSEENI